MWPGTETPFRVGIAVHFGRVSSSNIGQVAMRDATIIGDTVNTAFRLEGVNEGIEPEPGSVAGFCDGVASAVRIRGVW